MNLNAKYLLSLALLANSATLVADANTAVTPYLSYRSQSQDLARLMSGTVGHIYKADAFNTTKDGKSTESWKHNGSFAVTPEYTRSFDSKKIAQSLFGCFYLQNCNKLNITQQGTAGRSDRDITPFWFGLADDYEGSICFEPTIQNVNVDLDFYWGMDAWAKGLFFRVHAPITWTKWDLGAKFSTTTVGDIRSTYLDTPEKYLCKKETETTTFWDPTPLKCARFCGCLCDDNKTKTRLADIQADLGWNFLLNKNYHLGIFLVCTVAPTGNRPHAEWLFEPIVGNGHHWELGGGLTSSVILWHNQEENKHIGFYVDANVTHLFNAKQNRVFDLKDKPLSRYIEAFKGSGHYTYSSLSNLTSCEMKVNIAVQTDVTAMFNYTSKNWSYDLGYNFWYKSCEKFDCDSCDICSSCTKSCDSCCGKCIIKNGNSENWRIWEGDSIHAGSDSLVEIVLTDTMIDYNGARTKGMSNKVFGHIAYSWNDREVVPFLGLGGSVEFGRNNDCCCNNDCNDCCTTDCCSTCTPCCDDCSCCTYASLSQWGIWLKGGVSF